jgi:hypothetical protein
VSVHYKPIGDSTPIQLAIQRQCNWQSNANVIGNSTPMLIGNGEPMLSAKCHHQYKAIADGNTKPLPVAVALAKRLAFVYLE